jgi:hypothetical protein
MQRLHTRREPASAKRLSSKHQPSKQKRPELSPNLFALPVYAYCTLGDGGCAEIGFGASGAFGAVNPGITGVCPTVPFAAS